MPESKNTMRLRQYTSAVALAAVAVIGVVWDLLWQEYSAYPGVDKIAGVGGRVFVLGLIITGATIVSAFLISRSIRRRLRTQEDVEARALGLAELSHEVRAYLHGIIGQVQLLDDMPLSPDQRTVVRRIAVTSQSLLGIVDNILDLSRIDVGGVRLETRGFFLRELLEDTLGLAAQDAIRRGLGLRLEIEPSVPDHLVGDPIRLGQILLNLLSNAIKYTDHGSVTLHVSVFSLSRARARVRFQVIDTGRGLTAEQIEKIFLPFYQVEASASLARDGTGLGLFISRRLADAMKGEIRVESTVGIGSVVICEAEFLLPSAETLSAVPVYEEAPLNLKGKVALLVEDEPLNREVSHLFLERLGLAVIDAAGGNEALAILADNSQFDVVIVDLMMPEMDGYQLFDAIHHRPGLAGLPVIALTGNALEQERRKALDAGMSDYWTKPLTASVVVETFHRIFGADRPSAFPGVNERVLMIRLDGDRDLLRRLVRDFTTNYGHYPDRLRASLLAGDRDAAKALVHTLKGVAANLSADRVVSEAATLESALAYEDDRAVEIAIDALQVEIATIASGCDKTSAVTVADVSTGVQLEGEALVSRLRLLRVLLSRNDMAAQAVFLEFLPTLRELDSGKAAQVAKAIECLDFKEALQVLATTPGLPQET